MPLNTLCALPKWASVLLLSGALAACAAPSSLADGEQTGPRPVLPAPEHRLFPTVDIAPASGWASDGMPQVAAGLQVQAFARGLQHPRTVLALPNGDVLVAESDAPERPEDMKGIKGWIAQRIMNRAGSHRTSPDRILLLKDKDGDGIAESRSVLLDGVRSPFGMTWRDGVLYVAHTDAVWRYEWQPGEAAVRSARKLVDLPAGPINHHWTKDLALSPDGKRLYVSVGSNSNIAENGMEAERDRAAIHEIDLASGRMRLFASGLRNANGLDFEPGSGKLWAVVNERDELGNDLVPDYLSSIGEGEFFGWPWSYWGEHVDARVKAMRPDKLPAPRLPDYALGSHVAPLGMRFVRGSLWSEAYGQGAFVALHGSWNRKPKSGYKVVFVPFSAGKPNGKPVDVLSGFLNANGEAQGRPVGLDLDARGALLVADDVGGAVWRVSAERSRPERP